MEGPPWHSLLDRSNTLLATLGWVRITKTVKREQDSPPSRHTVPALEEVEVKSSKRPQETPTHRVDFRHNTAPEAP